jgi:hypothetical protein
MKSCGFPVSNYATNQASEQRFSGKEPQQAGIISEQPTIQTESSDPQRTDERRNPRCHMHNVPAKQDLPHNGAESIDFLAGNRHGMPTSL